MQMQNFYNLDAEREVLGAILMDNNCFCEVFGVLEPDDFHDARHQLLYNSMRNLYSEGKPVDIITLQDAVNGGLSEMGGVTYLSSLISSSFNTSNVHAYVNVVKEKSNKRKLVSCLNGTLKHAQNSTFTCSSILNELRTGVFQAVDSPERDNGDICTALETYLDDLEDRTKNGGGLTGLSTGYDKLDEKLGGLNPQAYVILAGRPSMGKSSVALNMAFNCAVREKAHVAVFSLEMSKKQCLDRLISCTSNVPMDNLTRATLSDEDWMHVGSAVSVVNNSHMRIFDEILSLSEIIAQCKKLKIQQGLDLVVIDYIQNIIVSGRSDNRTQQLSSISRNLKLLAKELNITVIALSQLSRAPEIRLDHHPLMSDLRDSGSLEQDADSIIFVYRKSYYHKDEKDDRSLDLIVSKNRNGKTGTVKLSWNPSVQKLN